MDHIEAIQSGATEKYLLGELTDLDREAFEAHFFECQECAAGIEAGFTFVEGAKQVLPWHKAEEPRRLLAQPSPRGTRWLSWLQPAYGLAAALLLGVVIYQSAFRIPKLQQELAVVTQPRVLDTHIALSPVSRGSEAEQPAAGTNAPVVLDFDLPPDGRFTSFLCKIQDESGKTRYSVPLAATQVKDTVHLLIPASVLPAGKYVLIAEGQMPSNGSSSEPTEIAHYPFRLEAK